VPAGATLEPGRIVVSDDLIRLTVRLVEWIRAGGGLVLVTDYDGTLTPIVADPAEARLAADVRADLQALSRSRRGGLAVISGRDLHDVRSRVAVPDAIYAGCHGLEIAGPDLSFTHPDAEAQEGSLRAVSLALCLGAPFVEGMRVEPKRLGVAVHYRHVTPSGQEAVQAMLARSLLRRRGPFKIFHGAKVIEVLPHVAWNKSRCVRWICDRLVGAGSRPTTVALYMGDDWTDEQVFEALAGEAVTIRVGTGAPRSRARYRLADVGEVHRLLSALAAATAAA
jgi:trehalose-phosphatase